MWTRIVGQERVKSLLRTVIDRKRIAHAYLFYGEDGVGTDAMAIEFARVLNCEKKESNACGVCQSCKLFDKLQHPNLKLIFALPRGKNERDDEPPINSLKDDEVHLIQEQIQLKAKNPYHRIEIPKASEIRINSIRQLRRDASLSAFLPGRKVYILFDADRMNTEASNALLKTLEEPSVSTVIILTTSRRDKLLPTILSRCQPVRLDPLSNESIKAALVERNLVSEERAQLIATIANGNFARALELLETDLTGQRDSVVAFLRKALGNDAINLFSQIEGLTASLDRSGIEQWLSLMLTWLRDAEAIRSGKSAGLVNIDQEQDLQSFVARFPNANHEKAIAQVERAIALAGRNVYLPLVLANLSFQLKDAISLFPKESLVENKGS